MEKQLSKNLKKIGVVRGAEREGKRAIYFDLMSTEPLEIRESETRHTMHG